MKHFDVLLLGAIILFAAGVIWSGIMFNEARAEISRINAAMYRECYLMSCSVSPFGEVSCSYKTPVLPFTPIIKIQNRSAASLIGPP